MFKRILHPTDFSEVSLQAFDQAVALSLLYGARLQLLHAVVVYEYNKTTVDVGMEKLNEAYDLLRAELQKQMEGIVEKSAIACGRCSLSVKRGFSAGEVIVEKAKESGSDLIVMGTHGHSPVRHFFLGSVAEKVVRYAPCPVMVLGRMEDSPGSFKSILLPVDFSNASHSAAELALDLANTHGARLHMLHVYEDVLPPAYSQRVFEWDPKLKQRGKFALEKFMNTHRSRGVNMEMHLIEGRAFRSIVDFSKEASIDLIVMGTAGLTGVHHFMVGSVTEKVLRNSDVPVLTVRADASSDK